MPSYDENVLRPGARRPLNTPASPEEKVELDEQQKEALGILVGKYLRPAVLIRVARRFAPSEVDVILNQDNSPFSSL